MTETFSLRQMRESGVNDVLVYHPIPEQFRGQATRILDDVYGTEFDAITTPTWRVPYERITEELGRQRMFESNSYLADRTRPDYREDIHRHLLECDTDGFLDALEILVEHADTVIRGKYCGRLAPTNGRKKTPDQGIEELNRRFLQHNLGYQFAEGQLIKVSSTFLYQSTTLPVLRLLSGGDFAGANEEFRQAHQRFNAGDYKAAVVACANAVESAMKTICDLRGWEYTDKAQAGDLIKIILRGGLIPQHLDDDKEGIQAMFRGLSVVRNRTTSAHGQGPSPVDVPQHTAAFALHLAASNLIYLVEQHRSKP